MLQPASRDSLTDEEIVDRVRAGDRALFELLLRRHNERIYRTVRSILRDETEDAGAVQGLSIEETAETLDLNTETVKTRLHRARGLLQKAILARTEPALARALPFPATRCDRVVAAVLRRIGVQ